MQKISIYQGVKSRAPHKTLTLAEFLDVIQNGTLGVAKFQQEVRSGKADKTRGLAATPSGTFKSRKDSHLITYNGLLNFDIDKLDDVDATFAQLAGDKYVLALWRSISGNGLTGLFYIDSTNAADHERAYKNMITYFRNVHSIAIDEKCSNISRLRFLSHDPALLINDAAEYFAWTPPKRKEVAFVDTSAKWNGSSNYISDFNENTDCVDLMQKYGWTVIKRTAKSTRLTRPGGSKGHVHGEVFNDNRFTNYSDHEDIGTSISCFDIFMHYEHSGNFESAKAAIKPEREYTTASPQNIPPPTVAPEYLSYEPSIELENAFVHEEVPKEFKYRDDTIRDFPVETLPKVMQEYIQMKYETQERPPELMALSMLCAISTAVGKTISMCTHNGWLYRTSLFAVAVGSSGSGKSDAMKDAFRPIQKAQEVYIKYYEDEMSTYDPDSKEKKPVLHQLLVQDATIEKTMIVLKDNPLGVGRRIDELQTWLDKMDKKGSDEEGYFLSIFDNDGFMKQTKTQGEEFVRSSYMTILAGTQPAKITDLAESGRDESGFLYRFIFAVCKKRKRKSVRELRAFTQDDELPWEGVINKVLKMREDMAQQMIDEHTPIKIELKGKAFDIWADWTDEVRRKMDKAEEEGRDDVVSLLQKIQQQHGRLMLINNIIRAACLKGEGIDVLREAWTMHPDSVYAACKQADYFLWAHSYVFDIIKDVKQTKVLSEDKQKSIWKVAFGSDKTLTSADLAQRYAHIKNNKRAHTTPLTRALKKGVLGQTDEGLYFIA